MMSITHAVIAVATTTISLGTFNPKTIGIAIISSQLPDVDTTSSMVGRMLFPISSQIEKRYPHRTITHSLIAVCVVAIAFLPLIHLQILSVKEWAAIPIAYGVSIFSDCFTRQGVQLLWPLPVWCVFGSNPNRRLITGGVGEYWVLSIAMLVVMGAWKVLDAGGTRPVVSQFIGMSQETISYVGELVSEREVHVTFIGRNKETLEQISIEGLVIDFRDNNLVLYNPSDLTVIFTKDYVIDSLRISRRGNPWRRYQTEVTLINERLNVVSSPPKTFAVGEVEIEGVATNLNYVPLSRINGSFVNGTLKILAYELN